LSLIKEKPQARGPVMNALLPARLENNVGRSRLQLSMEAAKDMLYRLAGYKLHSCDENKPCNTLLLSNIICFRLNASFSLLFGTSENVPPIYVLVG
jgi:hypothetical protein